MEAIQYLPPFNRIDDRARRQFLVRGRDRLYGSGETVWYQGEVGGRCALVTEGIVRSVMYRSDDSVLELGTSGPGEWIGIADK